jgi:hypothetical protein
MVDDDSSTESELRAFIESQRSRCLWYMREDYVPSTVEERLQVLDAIQRHGDRDAFVAADRFKRWLSARSSSGSAGS